VNWHWRCQPPDGTRVVYPAIDEQGIQSLWLRTLAEPGTGLGVYEVTAAIGEGGMGQV
jgi:hypothetical protein